MIMNRIILILQALEMEAIVFCKKNIKDISHQNNKKIKMIEIIFFILN